MEDAEDDIAVVGIGCNFPGGEGFDHFWRVLLEGRNCSVPITKERFDLASWYDPDDTKAGKSCTAKAALIDGFNEFDNNFFGISNNEVEQMDPQQKQVLQCVYRALENAGIPMEKAVGPGQECFLVSLMNRDYETNAAHVPPSVINHWTGTGLAMSIAANRVSYIFNFTGPSLSIDCACSSSLVALHLACQSIKQGDCDMAVCGGVSCIIEPRVFVALSKAKMISPEGTSKPFSSRADGYGRGEGCGVVLLEPLKKAIQDNDHVWGIISRTAVNQDGHTVSPITKPSMTQQEELLRQVYSQSDLENVQYIEAHGTGTPVGDPIEAGSISNIIAKARPPGSATLRIGSVKSNIGHTESAAGVAGLIKVLLMMKHETIVPSVFYSEDSVSVDAKALNIKVPTKVEKWEFSGTRIAGVNNFGFGGTNSHAIVKQYKHSCCTVQKNSKNQTRYFVLSANSQKSLTLSMEDTVKQLEAGSKVDLDSLVYTSACRRSHQKHKYRKAIMVSSLVDLREKLSATVGKKTTMSHLDSKLVFVFCGNGVTYHGMCKILLKHEPVFRHKIREITKLFHKLSRLNIMDTLNSESEGSNLKNPDVVQPLLFAIQVGIYTLFRHWGVKPDAILGHSVGEVAAAHCSGILSLEDAVKVIYFRSSLQSKVTGGKMLVISNMAISEVTALLPHYSGKICLAAFNSPMSCTLSGDADAIESLHKKLSTSANSQNMFLRVLDVPVAYHSYMMDQILPQIQATVGSLQNIREILNKTTDGKGLVSSLEENHHISLNERRCMVRILVSHLMERFGENPTSEKKTMLASAIVDQFSCLRDLLGTGFDAWFTPGRNHKPATGFLEERLRNARKRLRKGRQKNSAEVPPKETRTIVPESPITAELTIQMTEWLKNNIWPQSQVVQYMHDTATYRAQWIHSCGTMPMPQIIAKFPRLVDTPGMISQDFSILHPEASGKLTEKWSPVFSQNIIRMAKKEKTTDILLDLEMAGKEGDIALLLLPVLLPTAPYKVGKKVFRPSSLESRTAFIDVQPPGTNMVEYLSKAPTEYPHVLMLGEECQCSQAFVILNGTALEQPSLLGAVDICFKAYYVLDLVYPKPCAQVWECIQSVVFEMPGDVSNVVKLMRAQLSAVLE